MHNLPDLRLSYDQTADVLYLSFGQAESSICTKEDNHGLLWRVAVDGATIGVTILGFHQVWASRQQELTGILSSRFGVSPEALGLILETT